MPECENTMAGDFIASFSARFGEIVEEREPRRVWTGVAPRLLLEALVFLRDAGFRHLSTITALDTGTEMEIIYHLWGCGRLVSLRVRLDREAPRIDSAVPVMPAAMLYEREIRDLLGVEFTGHPDPRPLILPEEWPEGEHPLRRDWRPAQDGGAEHG